MGSGRRRRTSRGFKRMLIGDRVVAPCHWCGCVLPAFHLTIDHVIQLQCGGLDKLKNVVLACESCNLRRGKAQFWLNRNIGKIKADCKSSFLYLCQVKIFHARYAFVLCAGCGERQPPGRDGKLWNRQLWCGRCVHVANERIHVRSQAAWNIQQMAQTSERESSEVSKEVRLESVEKV